jgi:hypothetical protein
MKSQPFFEPAPFPAITHPFQKLYMSEDMGIFLGEVGAIYDLETLLKKGGGQENFEKKT